MYTETKLKTTVALEKPRHQVGLLGGNFNPVHNGHLVVAQAVLETLGLERIDFLPSFLPPHVDVKKTIAATNRLEMLDLATRDNPNFTIEDVEIQRLGKSYTIDTMRQLNASHPDTDYYFIIGGDMVEYLPKWKDIDELMTIVRFVGVNRPHYERLSPYPIIYVDVPQLEISSSLIRKKIQLGQSIRYLLPDSVVHYIQKEELYKDDRNFL
ncbi:nicotinate-nucleotide adenylyltransferase [Enterococcus timonensis]|uniref:nicotinate-nucleotide adenylyltransferase n=1 Tax=Enterococcus timonensis TaxID=1852364 RepID=UPI0008DAE618|nr:nicotinate-nucleotide adenylyltransferase [Enterococcus timonensis]